jgi:hypothetical protein
MKKIKLGKYQHFKGNFYQVLGLAKHSENLEEEFVVYKPLYKSEIFKDGLFCIRPKEMFFEEVLVSGKKQPRFKYIGPT